MKRFLLSILPLFTLLSALSADNWLNYSPNSSEGKMFYVTFMHNNAQAATQSLHLNLFVAARQTSHVRIRSTNSGFDTTITVTNSLSWIYPNATDVYLDFSDSVTNRTLLITSDNDIALYMANNNDQVGDASLVLPVECLDKEYVVQSTDVNMQVTEFAVIATEPGTTTLYITPSIQISQSGNQQRPQGVLYQVSLQQGQVYYGTSTTSAFDVSGTRICADRKVAVFNGSQDAYVREPSAARGTSSHVCHQSIPVYMLGKKYPIVCMNGQSLTAFKVTAVQNGTQVFVNGTLATTLAAFQSYYNIANLGDASFVETSKPALCYQYMSGSFNDVGTPSMSVATSLEQAVNSIKFTTFTFNGSYIPSFANVVVKTSAVSSMKLDNVSIASSFHPMTNLLGYSYARVSLTNGAHELTNASGSFIANVYSLDNTNKSYAYNAGLNCMHIDAHVNIDGAWTNLASKCKSADSTWIFNFELTTDQPYNSATWFDATEYQTIGTGQSISHTFTTPGVHDLYLVISRNMLICNQVRNDTITFKVNCASVYRYNLPIQYLCPGDIGYAFGDPVLADTLPPNTIWKRTRRFNSAFSCDSIVTERLYRVVQGDVTNPVHNMCQGDEYYFHGQRITESGTYPYNTDMHGCPYTIYQPVVVHPTYNFPTDVVTECNPPYRWRGKNYSVSGIYHDSLKTKKGCDSIYTLDLTVAQKYLKKTADTICDNMLPYVWHGRQFRTSGVYYDSLHSRYGCDSVWRLTLTVAPTFFDSSHVGICSNGSYVWRGHKAKGSSRDRVISGLSPGTYIYWDSLRTRFGCDSIYKLTVSVSDIYLAENERHICDVDSVHWQGRVFCGNRRSPSVPGATVLTARSQCYQFDDSLTSSTLCDSVVRLKLYVHATYTQDVSVSICQNESYYVKTEQMTWRNSVVGTHDTTFLRQSRFGCDSSVHLTLTVNPKYLYTSSGRTCTNEPYHWHDHDLDTTISQTVAKTETYEVCRTTKAGCDSIYRLTLTSVDTMVTTTTVSITDQQTYTWEGQLYRGTKAAPVSSSDIILPSRSAPYQYRNTHQSSIGCDSITVLLITVNPTYDNYDTLVTCQHSNYNFRGQTWSWRKDVVGVHDTTCVYQTVHHADSIWHVNLTVNPVYFFTEAASTCANEPYVWTGHNKTFSGLSPGPHVFYDSLHTSEGCDSIYQLTLSVVDTLIMPTIGQICDNQTFRWDTITFYGDKSPVIGTRRLTASTTPYTFRHSYRSTIGCDSFVTLSLMVYPTYEFYDTALVTCQHDTYSFQGQTWSWRKDDVGVHDTTYTYQSISGCDSVWHIRIRVNPVYFITEAASTCANEPYVWTGHNKTFSGLSPGPHVLYDSLHTGEGCDSIYQLTLSVVDTLITPTVDRICDNETFAWDTITFYGDKSPVIGTRRLTASTTPYTFRHSYRSSIGCDSFVTLSLMVYPTYEFYDTVLVTCQHDTYSFQGQTWSWRKDDVGVHDTTYTYQSIYGCDSVWHIRLRVNPVYFITEAASTCANEPYVWTGHNKTFSGLSPGPHVLYDSLHTGEGCDSIYQLTLSVVDTLITPTVDRICDNETFAWDTITFYGNHSPVIGTRRLTASTTPYTFRHSYRSSIGCDSFVTLSLMVYPTYEFYDTALVTCQHDTYSFQGQTWSWCKDDVGVHDTTYTYQSISGCDSVWHIRLRVNPVYFITEAASTCANEPYVWTGHNKTFSGLSPGPHVLYDSLHTGEGCDSVYQLTLNVVDTIVIYTYRTMCDNDTVIWQGSLFRGDKWQGVGGTVLSDSARPYVFNRLFTSVATGCDSIERLVLTVNRTDHTTLPNTSICQHETLRFGTHDILCEHSGTFTFIDSLQNLFGCDSVVQVTVRVDSVYRFETRETICDNIEWTWRGHRFVNMPAGDTVVIDSYHTIHGCDSTYTLFLKSISSYLFLDHYDMCDYDTVVWRSHTYYGLHPDTYYYYDSLLTRNGCDSVYMLTLDVHPHYFIHDTLSMCDNETIQVRTHSIYGPAGKYNFVDTLHSVNNCDSVIDLTVYINPTFFFPEQMTICSNETYDWHGKTYRNEGVYYDSLLTQYGCDSVYQLTLHVRPAYLFETYRTICDNESIVFHGVVLRDAGDHTFHYQTVEGCDSDYVVHLTVNPTYFNHRYVTICDNETCRFAGRSLNHSGIYYDSLRTVKGCDSVTILHLTVNPTYHFIESEHICSDDSYQWHGRLLNKAGIYYDSLHTEWGCDSIYELHLTVFKSYHLVIDTSICDFQTFRWSGKSYSQPGTYYDNKLSIHGCDSITTINLTVISTVSQTIYDTICTGETYFLGSKALTVSGIYLDTVCQPMVENCAFRTLHLTVNDPTVFTQVSVPDICADDNEFYISHRWTGAPPVRYSVLFDDDAKKQGFEDIVNDIYDGTIIVPVPPCVMHKSYVRPDHYKVTLQLDNGGCDPVANQFETDLLVKYPSWVIEQNWDDVVSLLNEFFNGGYKFSAYYWVVNGNQYFDETGSYIYWPDRLQIGDHVYIMLQRENESYYIPSCDIQVISHQGMSVTGDDLPFYVYNPSAEGALRLTSEVDGRFIISDAAGRRLDEGTIANGETRDLSTSRYPAGVYFIYFRTTDGRSTVRKFLTY